MTRISLAEEYDNRDMVAQMIALKKRQTESENTLVTYVSQCAASAQDAEDAKDAAVAAKDTAVAAATDTVRKTPAAAQTITGYPLTVTQGVTANLTGNVTGNVTGNLTGNVTGNVTGNADTATTATKLGSSTVGSAVKPIFINAGTATVCNEMCDLVSAQTVAGVKTFSASPVVPTVATGTADTKAANGTKVKNELDNYSPMVRTTGAQSIAGNKTFTGNILKLLAFSSTPGSYIETFPIMFVTSDSVTIGGVGTGVTSANNYVMMKVYDKTNTSYYSKLTLRLSNTGKVDLIMESNTSQGYNVQTLATYGS